MNSLTEKSARLVYVMLVVLLMLWANNRQSKRVRFEVGRPLVVIIPLLIIMLIFASVFSYRAR